MNPILAAIAVDAVYDSDLCVDGNLLLASQVSIPVRVKPDNSDVLLSIADTSISAKSLAFKVQVSACPSRPIDAVLTYTNSADTRKFKVTSASRMDSARLEWSCVAVLVKQ